MQISFRVVDPSLRSSSHANHVSGRWYRHKRFPSSKRPPFLDAQRTLVAVKTRCRQDKRLRKSQGVLSRLLHSQVAEHVGGA